MAVKLIPVNCKDIAEGFYSFRATATAPDGGMEVLYSETFLITDYAELRAQQANWLTNMQNRGYKGMTIKAVMQQDRPRWFGSAFQGQKPYVADDSLTINDLNREFILDL